MNIGWAVENLKAGERVCRRGWNGKGMWLGYVPGHAWNITDVEDVPSLEGTRYCLSFVMMSVVGGDLVPWLCSQTDLLAEDWELFKDGN